MQLLPLMLMLLWTLVEAELVSLTAPKVPGTGSLVLAKWLKKTNSTLSPIILVDKQVNDQLLNISKKYRGQEYWKYNEEFALMLERVEEALTLDRIEVDRKIDILQEFETFDAARIEMDRRIYMTIARLDQMLKDNEVKCVDKFKKIKKNLIRALNKANKTKSNILAKERLLCN